MTVLPSVKEARALGDELQRDPLLHANHAISLLNCIKPDGAQEPVVKAATQALKLFYISQLDAGALGSGSSTGSGKRQKLDPTAAAGSKDNDDDGAQQQYAAWLSRQYAAYVAQLLQLCTNSSSASLQVSAVSALMECARHEAGPAAFSNKLFSRLLTALVLSPNTQPEVVALLASRYLSCWDVRYHTLRTLSRLAQQRAVRGETAAAGAAGPAAAAAAAEDSDGGDDQQQQQSLPKAADDVARAMFDVLAAVQPIMPLQKQKQARQQQQQQQKQDEEEDEDDEAEQFPSWCGAAEAGLVTAAAASGSVSAKARRKRKQQQQQESGAAASTAGAAAVAWANRRLQQREYQAAWLALLRTDLPGDLYKKVLLKLHADVLPAMSSPLLLADFLTHALDQGGFEGMLALNSIFSLVTRHGLEYPAFYARLYGLITPDAFTNKHRSQFFRLADIFLASGMVPAYTAAAFAKRMARLALSAPPAGALLALAFVHNVVRRHPACMVLLHRPATSAGAGGSSGAAASASAGVDVYDASEPDPAKSRAVESSLWEVEALRNHVCPQVAAMCAVLDKDLSDRVRTSEVDVAPLLGASYASLLQQELARKLRRGGVPVAFYSSQPAGLFDGSLFGGGGDGSGDGDLAGWDLGSGAGGACAAE